MCRGVVTWINSHLELQVDAIDGRAMELQLHRVVLSERVRQVCTQWGHTCGSWCLDPARAASYRDT